MIDIFVTVTGPGGCLAAEYRVIYEALVAAGAKVTVHGTPQGGYVRTMGLLDTHIILSAVDQPWGG